ncbi:MAG: hypothetical protein H0U09_08025, partial [Geodermatophilaceae bacterium]|nr:hypothetical protein [Geodermatophilaceae bacterium]
LPWLSVKYVPVAAALALLGVLLVFRRRTGRDAAALVGALAVAGAAYLLLHRMIYGGWTVYAAGDHFQGSGEFGVVGFDPNYPGRSIRILGLLIDRDFGLAAWQPAWLLLVPAAAAMLGRRPARQPREAHSAALRSFARGPSLAQRTVLLVPLATGWLTATYIALTMHGFWWPGRQLVVVLPVGVLVILWWVSRLSAPAQLLGAVAASWGLGIYGVVLWRGWAGDTTWVAAPDRIDLHWPLAWLLPDDRVLAGSDVLLYGLWTVLIAVACWHTGRRERTTADRPTPAEAASRTSR